MNSTSDQRRSYQNKTDDIFNSPSSTPPLTQSTSSTSRSPPQPQPSTPPSRYSRSRYPADLARTRDGRLPLHRRGTSQKYEPFEDLLREAGYKETRIFTPETERVASEENSSGRSKVNGVVDFLSGFIPGSRSSSMKEQKKESHYSLPPGSPSPSPMSRRREKEQLLDQDATPRPNRMRVDGPSPTPPPSPPIFHHTHNNPSYTSITHSSSSKHMPPPPLPLPASLPNHHNNPVYHDPRPSRATAYLRHIASVPDMPGADLQRSRSSASHTRRRKQTHRKRGHDDTRYSDDDEDDDFNSVYEGRTRGNGEGEEDTNVPPLPKSWLETVARAVLFGSGSSTASLRPPELTAGSRAVSQPHPNSNKRLSGREVSPALRQLRQTRSVISRTGSLADAQYQHRHQSNLTRTQSARSALSATSRSGLSDRANRSHWNWATATPSPLSGAKSTANNEDKRPRPTLMSRFDGSSRSGASEGEIRKARVVCRSAPASRAASPSPYSSGTHSARSGSLKSQQSQERGRKKGSNGKGKGKKASSNSKPKFRLGDDDEPPSLTQTMMLVESSDNIDMETHRWLPHPNRSESGSEENRYLSGWGWDSMTSSASASKESPEEYNDEQRDRDGYFANPYSLSVSVTNTSDEAEAEVVESGSGSEEEDSSENEVNLAKMLQPRPTPQRQESYRSTRSTHSVSSLRSIRSLRKLLRSPAGNGTGAEGIPPVPPLPVSYNRSAKYTGADYLTPPLTSESSAAAVAGWPLDGDSAADTRYGTKSMKGKRASLPSGWTGNVGE
ncbi:hypothetical protein BT96DRAFT_914431 [Gymnopus androsaceus JB14]|uniref:Uncharacterized protein n=1 Tax=Gymnopus androsaceus JB14 TaxID=1447944 RepID=A0A6A4IDF6_9AGAR|nr:hypothetical protein BT96DRAFT_914431 [Gymnopus androsaceus JB14]